MFIDNSEHVLHDGWLSVALMHGSFQTLPAMEIHCIIATRRFMAPFEDPNSPAFPFVFSKKNVNINIGGRINLFLSHI